MRWFTTLVFACVYLGLAAGRIPGLGLDRAGIALLGAIALLAAGALGTAQAWAAIDAPTLILLFGLMAVSAQLWSSGFYAAITRRLSALDASPQRLLAWLIVVSASLASVLMNDVVCLAMAPVLVEVCTRRRLDPVPFLLALAAAANVGSAATLIGNPQNVLVGQRMGLSFGGYTLFALPAVVVSLVAVHAVIARVWRGRFERELVPVSAPSPTLDRGQAGKGLLVLGLLVVALLIDAFPREVVALVAAAMVLVSRRLRSRAVLAEVDWQLCVLFIALFVVHAAFEKTGIPKDLLESMRGAGVDVGRPPWLPVATIALSNVVSNVPAVMLLLPATEGSTAGYALALFSTFAGNLLLVGSIANLIVVEQASRLGVHPSAGSWFATHLRVGLPITLISAACAGLTLALAG
ncbi:MAG: SLC13 family permease [Planctomycetota bacterium]